MVRTMKRTTTKKKQMGEPQFDMSHTTAIIIIIVAIIITLLFTSYPSGG